jgi:hypothetical protein
MTVKEIQIELGLKEILLPEPEREARGAYIGDLLSWVMGKAREDNVWLTIMSNVNVIAVASLSDVSTVILCEGVSLDADAMEKAADASVNVLSSEKSSYELSALLHKLNI